MSRSLGLLISLFALILLLLSLFVFWIFTSGQINFAEGVDPFAERRMSKALGNSNIGGEFELINQDGQIVTDKDIFKEPTILYFGYTFAQIYVLWIYIEMLRQLICLIRMKFQ